MKIIIQQSMYDNEVFNVSVYENGLEVMSYGTDAEGVEEAVSYYEDHEIIKEQITGERHGHTI